MEKIGESRKRMAFLQYGGCVYRYFVCERDFSFDQLVSLSPRIKPTNQMKFKIAKKKWEMETGVRVEIH